MDIRRISRATGLSKPIKVDELSRPQEWKGNMKRFQIYICTFLIFATDTSFILSSSSEERIEISFEDDFGIFCSTTCVDYIELKIGNDMANTGYRYFGFIFSIVMKFLGFQNQQ